MNIITKNTKKIMTKQDDVKRETVIKIILIGDGAVGKTSLINKYINNEYNIGDLYISTIGVDFQVKHLSLNINGATNNYKVQIWDTAGQERFRAITRSYYRHAQICLICFDISDYQKSLNNVTQWITDIKEKMPSDEKYYIYIISTKVDIQKANILLSNNFSKKIEEWENIENVKFLGWCSTKNNLFVPYAEVKDQLIIEINNFNKNGYKINNMFDTVITKYVKLITKNCSIEIHEDVKDNKYMNCCTIS